MLVETTPNLPQQHKIPYCNARRLAPPPPPPPVLATTAVVPRWIPWVPSTHLNSRSFSRVRNTRPHRKICCTSCWRNAPRWSPTQEWWRNAKPPAAGANAAVLPRPARPAFRAPNEGVRRTRTTRWNHCPNLPWAWTKQWKKKKKTKRWRPPLRPCPLRHPILRCTMRSSNNSTTFHRIWRTGDCKCLIGLAWWWTDFTWIVVPSCPPPLTCWIATRLWN
mmetsp:Transcript_12810/g.28178  ORF Transcript_12810/g.28178 Transcript_12810/m.28178 type:complete len:220 (-) Transcript_12810:723-1382(-)